VRFHKIIQDSQDYGSDDEHMVSRVFLSLEAADERFDNLTVDVKQSVGEAFESGPLEVSRPKGYHGRFNYAAFRVLVESYFRSQVGSAGRGIRIAGASNVRMRNNTFHSEQVAEFEYAEGAPGW